MTTASEPAPGPVYLDASALAKLYLAEEGSRELERRLLGRRDLLVSELAVTEIVSAVSRRFRQGEFPAAAAARFYQRLLGDLDRGVFSRLSISRETHRAAERILLASQTGETLRALDSLHLALAIEAEARSLLTYDDRLARAATQHGLAC
ncbi:MAG: type II toxin-antitoxin system VapC family toxin [Thermoanaerobaculia bacterium]